MNAWTLTLNDTCDDSFSTGTTIEATDSADEVPAAAEAVSGPDGEEGAKGGVEVVDQAQWILMNNGTVYEGTDFSAEYGKPPRKVSRIDTSYSRLQGLLPFNVLVGYIFWFIFLHLCPPAHLFETSCAIYIRSLLSFGFYRAMDQPWTSHVPSAARILPIQSTTMARYPSAPVLLPSKPEGEGS